jgi:hypothetical protein
MILVFKLKKFTHIYFGKNTKSHRFSIASIKPGLLFLGVCVCGFRKNKSASGQNN